MGFQEFLEGKKPQSIPVIKKPGSNLLPEKVVGYAFDLGVMPAVTSLSVPGALPETIGRNGRIIEPDNLEAKRGDIIGAIKQAKKGRFFASLIKRVESGDTQAVYTITAGLITIFIAATGVELGIRRGQDIKNLRDIIRGRKSPQ